MNHTKTNPVDRNDVGVEMLLAAGGATRVWWMSTGVSGLVDELRRRRYCVVAPKQQLVLSTVANGLEVGDTSLALCFRGTDNRATCFT
jgi:hypothetical protein